MVILVRDLNNQAPDEIAGQEIVTTAMIEEYLIPIRKAIAENEKLRGEIESRMVVAEAKAGEAYKTTQLNRPPTQSPDEAIKWDQWPDAWKMDGKFAFTAHSDAEFAYDNVKIVIRKGSFYEVPGRVFSELLARGVI